MDPALVRAILSDYEYNDSNQLATLHDYLDTLRASAVADDASSFDPTGTSNGIVGSKLSQDRSASEGWERATESGRSKSDDTEITNLSHDLSTADLKDYTDEAMHDFEILDVHEKEKRLGDLFPSQTSASISYTLNKSNGSFGKTMDILLNHVYFDESGKNDGEEKVQAKGIDAFDEALHPRGRRKKGKPKQKRLEFDSPRSSSEGPGSTPDTTNHWKSAAKDIEFISERTGMPHNTIGSLYHKNGAAVKSTLVAIVEQEISTHKASILNDPIMAVNAATLAEDFPTLSSEYAAALTRITSPSTANANELAKAMTTSTWSNYGPANGKIVPQYAPIELDDSLEQSGSRNKASSTPSSGRSSPSISAAKLSALRSSAFTSASNYHRKAGSDRLFGGAAAYYGQVGREYHSQLRAASAAEADAFVESNSTTDSLDLHGVSVQDAVRIAEREVDRWWQNVRTREARTRSERIGNGFTVVTGRGAHSKDGKGRIGPAVVKVLVRNGWKVEVGSGNLTVTGRIK